MSLQHMMKKDPLFGIFPAFIYIGKKSKRKIEHRISSQYFTQAAFFTDLRQ